MNTLRASVIVAKELGCKTAAEIGVFQGHNALTMFEYIGLDKLYLIDPYIMFVEPSSGMGRTPDFPRNEKIALSLLSGYANKCVWIKKKSAEAVIPPVDFVYIDGSHEYDNVCSDLARYYPLATKIIGGHDYFNKPGVKRAVDEFAERNGLKLNTKKSDWWIVKY